MRAGNASPRALRHKAPNKEINNSKLGIATASKTVETKEIFVLPLKRKLEQTYMWQRPKVFSWNIPRSCCCSESASLGIRSMWCQSRHNKLIHGWWRLKRRAFPERPELYWKTNVKLTSWSVTENAHISFFGKFNVIVPNTSEPKRKYPNSPINTYRTMIINIAWEIKQKFNHRATFSNFNSNHLCWELRNFHQMILVSSSRFQVARSNIELAINIFNGIESFRRLTTPIASKAKRTVPKKSGKFLIAPNACLSSNVNGVSKM